MAIPEGLKANFETLKRAFADNRVALVECSDANTGAPVFAICALSDDDEQADHINIVPFASLFNGNPYEMLNPPTEDQQGEALRDDDAQG